MFPATNPLTPSKTFRAFRETIKPCPIRKSKWSSHMKSQVAPSAFVSSSRMASPKSTDSSFPEKDSLPKNGAESPIFKHTPNWIQIGKWYPITSYDLTINLSLKFPLFYG